jgi:hypothetical protein
MSTHTKPRGLQAKPTRSEVSAAWGRLRSAANSGDLQAAALLVALAENKPLLQLPAAISAIS